jgi:hypothetical protein
MAMLLSVVEVEAGASQRKTIRFPLVLGFGDILGWHPADDKRDIVSRSERKTLSG